MQRRYYFTWMVLPSPISSARMALHPLWCIIVSHRRPRTWQAGGVRSDMLGHITVTAIHREPPTQEIEKAGCVVRLVSLLCSFNLVVPHLHATNLRRLSNGKILRNRAGAPGWRDFEVGAKALEHFRVGC